MIRITNESHEKSSTCQALLKEGGLRFARSIILEMGGDQLGPADETTVATIRVIKDVQHLIRLASALLKATSWAEWLQTP